MRRQPGALHDMDGVVQGYTVTHSFSFRYSFKGGNGKPSSWVFEHPRVLCGMRGMEGESEAWSEAWSVTRVQHGAVLVVSLVMLCLTLVL